MQSNIYTSKIVKHSKNNKLEAREKTLKQAHKGKTWQRGTDKRNMNFDGL